MSIRLISDENISWRIKKHLPGWDILPANEIQANSRQSDNSIWNYAKANRYHILTFDEDFFDLQNLYSYPPKIIWLRLVNCSTREIAERLLTLENMVVNFLNNKEAGVFEIYL